jgi:polyhydroxybutyrate depolymerase
MRLKHLALAALLLFAAPTAAQPPSPTATLFPPKASLSTATPASLIVNGVKRTYLVQTPAGGGPFPVILILHGATQTGSKVWTQTSLPLLGSQGRAIVVAPDALKGRWNDGREKTLSGKPSTADDVGFLRALIGEVIAKHNGDSSRVFITGASNGGGMTLRMMCEASDLLTAAAPVIITLPESLSKTCRPAKPVRLLLINGTADPLVNFNGGTSNDKGNDTAPMLSVAATMKFWAGINGCGTTLTQFKLPDLDPNDGSTVRRNIYAPCTSGKSIGNIVIDGGGHTWPNGPPVSRFVERIIGTTNNDIDAGAEIWNFFSGRTQ